MALDSTAERPTKPKRKYATSVDFPGLIPPGEIWIDQNLSPAEQENVIAALRIGSPAILQSEADVQRTGDIALSQSRRENLTRMLVEEIGAKQPEKLTVNVAAPKVDVAAPNVNFQAPDFPVKDLALALAEALANAQAKRFDTLTAAVDALTASVKKFTVAAQAIEKAITNPPAARPSRRRIERDGKGIITAVIDEPA